MYNFLIELLKIIVTLGFLAFFVYYFKKAINIAKITNAFLSKNFQINEKEQQNAVKKTVFKFVFAKDYLENNIHNFLNDLSVSEKYLINQK